MLDKFIKAIESVISKLPSSWLILGALIAAILILALGLLMTLLTAKELAREGSCLHVIRSRSRRNIIFSIAFVFVIVSTLSIYYLFPGAVLFYLSIPALVLLWAFICEALFECIDDRNRKKSGIKLCVCDCSDCPDCTLEAASRKTIGINAEQKVTERNKEEIEADLLPFPRGQRNPVGKENKKKIGKKAKKRTGEKTEKKAEKIVEKKITAKTEKAYESYKPYVEKKSRAEAKLDAKKSAEEEAKRNEIQEVLKRAQELERERGEMKQSRAEQQGTKSLTYSEEEELRRQKFEEERKQLASLARQAEFAQFGSSGNSKPVAKPAPTPVTKPVSIPATSAPATTSAKPAPAPVIARSETTKQSLSENQKLAPAQTFDSMTPAPKPESVYITTAPETKTVTTVTRSNNIVASESKSVTADAKFTSLQAKLEILRKDTSNTTSAVASKPEPRGKYDESEVRSALADLIKSMNARRRDEE